MEINKQEGRLEDTDKMIEVLNATLGELPFNLEIYTPLSKRVRVGDIMNFFESFNDVYSNTPLENKVEILEGMLQVLQYAPYKIVKELNTILESKNKSEYILLELAR